METAGGEEKSVCFIEGTSIDKNAAATVTDLHELVWYRMRPPKVQKVMYAPFVSARQIDLVRSVLTGKNAAKAREREPQHDRKVDCKPKPLKKEGPSIIRRDVIPKRPDLDKRKSSVRFLNKYAYE